MMLISSRYITITAHTSISIHNLSLDNLIPQEQTPQIGGAMQTDSSRKQHRVWAAFVVGSVALLLFGVQPTILAALAESGEVSEAGIGSLASAEYWGLTIGTLIGPKIMLGKRLKIYAAAVAMLAIAANVLLPFGFPETIWMLNRFAAGTMAGMLMGATILVITSTPNPDRTYGVFYAVATVPQMVGGYLMPAYITPTFGPVGGFATMALAACASLLAAFWLATPSSAHKQEANAAQRPMISMALLSAMAAVVIHNAAIGAAWSYADRLGTLNGLDGNAIGTMFAVSFAAQIVGGLAFSAFGWRLSIRLLLCGGMVLMAAATLAFLQAQSSQTFILVAAIFGFLWVGLLPAYLKLLVTIDETTWAGMISFPVGLGGWALGAAIAAYSVTEGQPQGAFLTSSVLFVVACSFYAIALHFHKERSRAS
jgi:MFS transporter, DHA1 family, inner membrane transport protein